MYRVEIKELVDLIDGVPIYEWWPQSKEWETRDQAEVAADQARHRIGRAVVVVERNGKEEKVL